MGRGEHEPWSASITVPEPLTTSPPTFASIATTPRASRQIGRPDLRHPGFGCDREHRDYDERERAEPLHGAILRVMDPALEKLHRAG